MSVLDQESFPEPSAGRGALAILGYCRKVRFWYSSIDGGNKVDNKGIS